MDVVIDTSAIIAVIANEPIRPKLIAATVGATLFAPASVHWEVGNAFAAMLKRRRIDLVQAVQALEGYQQIPVRFVDVGLKDSLTLAQRYSLYAHDVYVVECALKLRCDLLALDRGLIEAAKLAGLNVMEVAS